MTSLLSLLEGLTFIIIFIFSCPPHSSETYVPEEESLLVANNIDLVKEYTRGLFILAGLSSVKRDSAIRTSADQHRHDQITEPQWKILPTVPCPGEKREGKIKRETLCARFVWVKDRMC